MQAQLINPLERPDRFDSQQLHIQFDELCTQAVLAGQTASFFQDAISYVKSNHKPEEFHRGAELVKRRLAIAIANAAFHCGQPLSVSGNYDFETGRHSILVRCSCCRYHSLIEESIKHVN
jgi:hypothetical protein